MSTVCDCDMIYYNVTLIIYIVVDLTQTGTRYLQIEKFIGFYSSKFIRDNISHVLMFPVIAVL